MSPSGTGSCRSRWWSASRAARSRNLTPPIPWRGSMRECILRRLVSMVPVLFIVSLISFALLYILPGDPAIAMLGENAGTQETYRALRREMGLDDPLIVQYGRWLI